MPCISRGLSLLSQRAEVAVSGSSTPTFLQPLPLLPLLVGVLLLLPVLALPQAEASKASNTMLARMANVLRFRSNSFIINMSFRSVLIYSQKFTTQKYTLLENRTIQKIPTLRMYLIYNGLYRLLPGMSRLLNYATQP